MLLHLEGYPNPRQKDFFLSRSRHTAYGGARGGGKSWAMRRKFVLLALRYEGLQLLLLRRTLPELVENHVRPLLAELSGKVHSVYTGICTLPLFLMISENSVFTPKGRYVDAML